MNQKKYDRLKLVQNFLTACTSLLQDSVTARRRNSAIVTGVDAIFISMVSNIQRKWALLRSNSS